MKNRAPRMSCWHTHCTSLRRTILRTAGVTLAIAVAVLPAPNASSDPGIAAMGDALAAGGPPVAIDPFLAPDDAPLAEYRARRLMRAENARFNAQAELEAVTQLWPDGRFSYEIVREEGSGHVRNKVLRKVLKDEADLRRRGDTARGGLTEANYVFTPDPVPGPSGERRVRMVPRRKDVLLVDGSMVLTAEGDLLRIEGRLAKNPSFWTRRVHIVRRYGRVAGVRVPIATESTADIRFAGQSRFRMDYQYESVNGRPVTPEEPAAAAGRMFP